MGGCACVGWVVCVRVERYDDLRISECHHLCGKVICDNKDPHRVQVLWYELSHKVGVSHSIL